MAGKLIDIKLATSADLAAIRAVNSELAKMAMDVGRKNGDMRQATMQAAREYYNLGDAADKAASRAVLSAREIEKAWRKAMAKPTEDAEKGFGRLAAVARNVAKGIGGQFSRVGELLAQGGIWGVASMALTKAFDLAWRKVRESAEREAKRTERAWKDGLASIKDGAAAVAESYAKATASIDKAISRFDAATDSVKELTKAEIELAKQRAIANGMDPASANAAAADLSTQVDDEAEERRLRNLIEMERKYVDAAKDAEAKSVEQKLEATKKKEAAEDEYQRKRKEYIDRNAKTTRLAPGGAGGGFAVVSLSDSEIAENRAAAAEDFEETDEAKAQREKIRSASDLVKSIKTDEKALADADDARKKIEQAERALDTLATRRAAREQATQNEIAAKVEEESQKREAAEASRIAEAKAAEVKAAQEAARERERLDREAHRRRMEDLRAEIAEQQKAAVPLRAAVSAAQGEFDRAFAMYRDPARAAAEIGEEKAYARDLDRLHRDAARYGVSWRIDELSRLMSAGDSQGAADALKDWRKSRRFTPEVEAMVRASAAERVKTTAEDELRKIEANTSGLAEKLDQLLTMKG